MSSSLVTFASKGNVCCDKNRRQQVLAVRKLKYNIALYLLYSLQVIWFKLFVTKQVYFLWFGETFLVFLSYFGAVPAVAPGFVCALIKT